MQKRLLECTIRDTQSTPGKDIPQIVHNRYVIKKLIGSGGMGTIFVVQDLVKQGELCALKKINEYVKDQETLNKFKQEFEMMVKLRHPHLVRVFDIGFDSVQDIFYFTMEYVRGKSLDTLRGSAGPMKVPEAIAVLISMSRVLNFIHSRSIIHRDIKPSNIILSSSACKLIDFGLAHVGLTDFKKITGTVQFMAPEAVKGYVDQRSDIFALGLTLFHCIAPLPFYENYDAVKVIQVLSNEPEFNRLKEKQLSLLPDEPIRTLINTMLAYHKSDRYQTCIQLITAVNTLYGAHYALETAQTKQAYVLGARLIGRQKEFRYLKEYVQNTHTTQKGLWVKGESGIGKSRLFSEFKQYCQLKEKGFVEGNCYEDIHRMFGPFCTILNELLFIASPETIANHGMTLKQLVSDHPRLNSFTISPQLSNVNAERIHTIKTIAHVIVECSFLFKEGLVLYLNDMQWSDSCSIETVHKLFEMIKQSQECIPLFIFMSSRLEQINALETLQLVHHLDVLQFQAFDDAEVKLYIEALFGADSIGKTLRESISTIHKRVGGNPFFLQELIKLLIDTELIKRTDTVWELTGSIESVTIPKKLEQIIESRLMNMRLQTHEQKILEVMALLIRRISWEELYQIIPVEYQFLQNLEYLEIIHSEYTTEHVLYYLSHDLIRETITKMLPEHENKFLHKLIAEGLQTYHSHELDQYLDDLSHHFLHAELIDKAIEYLEKLSDYSLAHDENCRTIEINKQLRALYKPDETEKHLDLLIKDAESHYKLGNFHKAKNIYEQVITLSQEQKFPYKEAVAKLNVCNVIRFMKDTYDIVIAYLNQALDYFHSIDDKNLLARCYNSLGDFYYSILHDFNKSKEFLAEGLAIAKQIQNKWLIAANLGNLNRINFAEGNIDKAITGNYEVLAIFQELNAKMQICIGLSLQSSYHIAKKEYHSALLLSEQQLQIATDIKAIHRIAEAHLNIAEIQFALKNFSLAEIHCKEFFTSNSIGSHTPHELHAQILSHKIAYAISQKKQGEQELMAMIDQVNEDTIRAKIFYELYGMSGNDEFRYIALDLYVKLIEKAPDFIFKQRIFELQSGLRPDIYTPMAPTQSDQTEMPMVSPIDKKVKGIIDSLLKTKQSLLRELNHISQNHDSRAGNEHEIEHEAMILHAQNAIDESLQTVQVDISQPLHRINNSTFYDILGIIRDMNSNIPLAILLEKIADLCITFFDADRGAILLMEKNGKMSIKTSRGNQKNNIPSFSISQTIIHKILEEKKPVLIQNTIDNSVFAQAKSVTTLNVVSVLCMPLENKLPHDHTSMLNAKSDTLFGMIYLDCKKALSHSYTDNWTTSVELFETLADQAAIAIYKTRQHDKLKKSIDILKNKITELTELLSKSKEKIIHLETKNRSLNIQLQTSNTAFETTITSTQMTQDLLVADLIDETLIQQYSPIEKYSITIIKDFPDTLSIKTNKSIASTLIAELIKKSIDAVSTTQQSRFLTIIISKTSPHLILLVVQSDRRLSEENKQLVLSAAFRSNWSGDNTFFATDSMERNYAIQTIAIQSMMCYYTSLPVESAPTLSL